MNQFPKEILTEKNLLVKDNGGNTPLHVAALNGRLNQFPKELLTEKTLQAKNRDGEPPLHFAADARHLDQLLGIEFSETVKNIVGEDWWKKNQTVLEEMRKAKETKAVEAGSNWDEFDLY